MRGLLLAVVGLLVFGLATPALALPPDTTFWKGGTEDHETKWHTAANWSNGVPAAGGVAIFDPDSSDTNCIAMASCATGIVEMRVGLAHTLTIFDTVALAAFDTVLVFDSQLSSVATSFTATRLWVGTDGSFTLSGGATVAALESEGALNFATASTAAFTGSVRVTGGSVGGFGGVATVVFPVGSRLFNCMVGDITASGHVPVAAGSRPSGAVAKVNWAK